MAGEKGRDGQEGLVALGAPRPSIVVANNSTAGARLTCRLGLQTAFIAALVTIISFHVLEQVGPFRPHSQASYKQHPTA